MLHSHVVRVRILAAAALVALAVVAAQASAVFQVITVSTTSIGIAAATRDGAKNCYLTVETNPIRWRYDGAAPTSTVGHPVAAGGQIVLTTRTEMDSFKAIRDTTASGDATVEATCEK